jgi:hypothetical protein
MIKMTCGICKGSGHIGPDGDMVTEQPCCQCNGSGVVFVVAPTQPATNTGSPKLVEDLECARDWLLPGRPVLRVEIDNCISELNDIINQLRAGA